MRPIKDRDGSSLLGEKGVNMIEVMVAIAMLSIGILATGALQMRAVESNSLANRHSTASRIASWAMEELIHEDNLNDFEFNDGEVYDSPYTVSYVAEPGPTGDSRWLTVNIDWVSTNGDERQTLRYLKYDP